VWLNFKEPEDGGIFDAIRSPTLMKNELNSFAISARSLVPAPEAVVILDGCDQFLQFKFIKPLNIWCNFLYHFCVKKSKYNSTAVLPL